MFANVSSTVSASTPSLRQKSVGSDLASSCIVGDVSDGITSSIDDDDENDGTDRDNEQEDAALRSILSQISTWMRTKQQKDNSKHETKPFDDEPRVARRRPFITLAYAQTLDGMIAAKTSNDESEATTTSNMRLSSPQSTVLTHRLRNMHDAILVGGSTFLVDAPRLNVRLQPDTNKMDSMTQQPIPVVLDTHLNALQQVLWGEVLPQLAGDHDDEEELVLPQDMQVDNIRANNPVICCSSDAAKVFLDHLEIFQLQQTQQKKRQKIAYTITVYKLVDEENDHEEDLYLPIKISVQVVEIKAQSMSTTTFTLLPCQVDQITNSLDLRHVMSQLYNHFEVDSVMVEGGAQILSSFMNECVKKSNGKSGSKSSLVDCLCVTISPVIMGGKWGLPVSRRMDAMMGNGQEVDGTNEITSSGLMRLRDEQFVSLGSDCIVLGRI